MTLNNLFLIVYDKRINLYFLANNKKKPDNILLFSLDFNNKELVYLPNSIFSNCYSQELVFLVQNLKFEDKNLIPIVINYIKTHLDELTNFLLYALSCKIATSYNKLIVVDYKEIVKEYVNNQTNYLLNNLLDVLTSDSFSKLYLFDMRYDALSNNATKHILNLSYLKKLYHKRKFKLDKKQKITSNLVDCLTNWQKKKVSN